jgi:hypothetical protein
LHDDARKFATTAAPPLTRMLNFRRMRCTVLLPGLFPSLSVNGARPSIPRLPALETMLARGDTTVKAAFDHNSWICQTFGVPKQNDWPVAPLLLRADGGDPGKYFWLRADPVHLRPDRSRLVLAAVIHDLNSEESAALVAALNLHFAPDGIVFHATASQSWYLRAERVPRITTTPLAQAVGRDIDRHLPRGEDALAWHRIINEAQMTLHEHPVNVAREARGLPAVNSIWPWGGGVLPSHTTAPYAAVLSNDPLVRALAAAAHHPLPLDAITWLAEHSKDHAQLMVFDALENAAQNDDLDAWQTELVKLDRDWITPLLAASRKNNVADIKLVMPGTIQSFEIELTPSHLWRWWRRQRPLMDYLT